jgi:hypothetical protein
MKLFWLLSAVASWVIPALFHDEIAIPSFLFVFISALGWFCMIIAIGGKKGLPIGIGVLIFAGCITGILVKLPQTFHDFLSYMMPKPGAVFFWLGVLVAMGLALLIPSVIAIKLWGLFFTEKGTKKEGKKIKKESRYDWKNSFAWKRHF